MTWDQWYEFRFESGIVAALLLLAIAGAAAAYHQADRLASWWVLRKRKNR